MSETIRFSQHAYTVRRSSRISGGKDKEEMNDSELDGERQRHPLNFVDIPSSSFIDTQRRATIDFRSLSGRTIEYLYIGEDGDLCIVLKGDEGFHPGRKELLEKRFEEHVNSVLEKFKKKKTKPKKKKISKQKYNPMDMNHGIINNIKFYEDWEETK